MLLLVAPEQEPVQSTAPLFTERCPAVSVAGRRLHRGGTGSECLLYTASGCNILRQGYRGFDERNGSAFRRFNGCRQS